MTIFLYAPLKIKWCRKRTEMNEDFKEEINERLESIEDSIGNIEESIVNVENGLDSLEVEVDNQFSEYMEVVNSKLDYIIEMLESLKQ